MHSDHHGAGHGVWVSGAISRSERIHLFPGEFHTFCGLKEGYSLCVRVITGKLCGIDECRVAFAQVWHTVWQCVAHCGTVWRKCGRSLCLRASAMLPRWHGDRSRAVEYLLFSAALAGRQNPLDFFEKKIM